MGQGIEEAQVIGNAGSWLETALERLAGDWLLWACILLTGTLCFALGLVIAREAGASKDQLWIEQLPASAMSGSVATTTSGAAGKAPEQAAATSPIAHPQPAAAAAALPATSGTYMASKTGSKYYLPSCGSAKRIKEENRVWFATKQEAEAAGYEPAANCKGL